MNNTLRAKITKGVDAHNYNSETGIINITHAGETYQRTIEQYMQWNLKKGWTEIGSSREVAEGDFNGSWPRIVNGLLALMLNDEYVHERCMSQPFREL